MNSNGDETFRRWLLAMMGTGVASSLFVLGFYWYWHRYASGLGYLVDIPILIGMLGLPVTLLTTAIAGYFSYRLAKQSEQVMAPLREQRGIHNLLDACSNVMRTWLNASGDDNDRLVIALPVVAFGFSEAFRRPQDQALHQKAEEFGALLSSCLKGSRVSKVVFATNAPYKKDGRQENGLSKFLETIADAKDSTDIKERIYRKNLRELDELISDLPSNSAQIYFSSDIHLASVCCVGSRTEGVLAFRELNQTSPAFFSTNNPKAVDMMYRLVESFIKGSRHLLVSGEECNRDELARELMNLRASSGNGLPALSPTTDSKVTRTAPDQSTATSE